MAIDKQLLKILVCPETRAPLRLADDSLVKRLNQAIAQGSLKNRIGQTAKSPIDGGLVQEDGKYFYPIIDGIPVLLTDESIPLEQVN